jgi:DNA-binding NtrC family response regulator/tetratricopeptide (TPR) repeat protein
MDEVLTAWGCAVELAADGAEGLIRPGETRHELPLAEKAAQNLLPDLRKHYRVWTHGVDSGERSKMSAMLLLADVLGDSPGIVALREKLSRLLQHPAEGRRLPPILMQGETGTGKGLLARAIHREGPRRGGPFVDVNCAAIPEALLEAEMFGFERGAFTGARRAKAGLLQAAHRGTIFLDEVGLLPAGLQVKLLKAIEERAVRRLGSTRTEPVDVWILAAANQDLEVAAREGRFRADLYHRLAVLTLWLPPLRERGRDVLLLAEHLLAQACADYQLTAKTFDETARAALFGYRWPGNVRELANAMERVALLTDGPVVTAELLRLPVAPGAPPPHAPGTERVTSLEDAVGSVEREHLVRALDETNWNISRAAARLGIPRNTLRYRVEKYGLRREGSSTPLRLRAERALPAEPAAVAATPAEIAVRPSVRWEQRRLTFLRVDLVPTVQERPFFESSRPLDVFVDKVQSFGGQVEELSSIAMVAVFGLEPMEDAPRRAALVAMAIRRAVESDQRGTVERLAVKLGLHVGQFMVGRINGSAEIDRDAKREAGRVLELLLEQAALDTILVTEAAATLLARRFEMVPVTSLAGAPGRVYSLGRERSRLGQDGQLTRFVGRPQELEILRRCLAAAMTGHGQVVGVVGEAGIGKSRLLLEFRLGLNEDRIAYLEGSCHAYAAAIPYFTLVEILRNRCGILEADTPDAIHEKVRRSLQAMGMDLEESAPYLLHLLAVDAGNDRLADLAPEAIKVRTFEALREMSLKSSWRQPLILVVEDLQWIDKTSEDFIASLVESIAGAHVLLVSTYRSGYRPRWLGKSYATQIALQPLSPEDALRMLQSVPETETISQTFREVIVAKAVGNPFFLEELTRAALEQGDVSPALTLPDTIQEVLMARVDRLPPEEKRLLQSASVVGKNVPFTLLGAAVGLPDQVLRQGLGRLQSAEFLYEVRSVPELEYTFKHVLTQEAAYASLLPRERKVLHAKIVETLEGLAGGRSAEQTEALAHHAFHGELWEKALRHLRQAGRKAFARAANLEAVAYFEQAVMTLEHVPESRDKLVHGVDLRFELRNALWALGQLARGLEYLREAESLAEALGDKRRLARLAAHTGGNYLVLGETDRALHYGEQALSLAATLDDFELQIDANQFRGVLYSSLGDYPRAVQFLERSITALVGDRGRGRFSEFYAVHGRTWLVWSLSELGKFHDARTRADEGTRIAEGSNHPHNLVAASWADGYLNLTKGDYGAAVAALEHSLAVCRATNIAVWLRPCMALLGHAYALGGRVPDAVPLLEQAVRHADENNVGLAAWETYLGEAYLLAGRLDEAGRLAGHSLGLARERKERGFEAYALRLTAEIAVRYGRVAEAEESYHRALALAAGLGMRPLTAHGHVGLGALHFRTGNLQRADEHRLAASALISQLDVDPDGFRPAIQSGNPSS